MGTIREVKSYDVKEVLDNIEELCNFGQRAAGTATEIKAARWVKKKFGEAGLRQVHLESFPVVCWDYQSAKLQVESPVEMEINCTSAGQSPGTPIEGLSGTLVDVGFGTEKDYKRLRREGIKIKDKIVLIERNDELLNWPTLSCFQALEFGAKAVILESVDIEHQAVGQDVVNSPIPTIWISYKDAQRLRELLSVGEVIVRVISKVKKIEEAKSYNVVGILPGRESKKEILVTAHHDSWFGGANDNAVGVASIIQIAKMLINADYKPKYTLKFISFGAEESGAKNPFYWLVGSKAYTEKHKEEMNEIIGMVNLDAYAYGTKIATCVSPELAPFVKGIISSLGFEERFTVTSFPSSGTDQWFFTLSGVPTITFLPSFHDGGQFRKIYHTDYDVPLLISRENIKLGLQVTLECILKFNRVSLLPYNFAYYMQTYNQKYSEKYKKAKNLLNLTEFTREIRKFQKLTKKIELQKNKVKEKSEQINNALRKISTLLNSHLIYIDENPAQTEVFVPLSHLDALITLNDVISALKENDINKALESFKKFPTIKWGQHLTLYSYNRFLSWFREDYHKCKVINELDSMDLTALMDTFRSLKRKVRQKKKNMTKEIKLLQREFDTLKRITEEKILKLTKMFQEAQTVCNDILKILK